MIDYVGVVPYSRLANLKQLLLSFDRIFVVTWVDQFTSFPQVEDDEFADFEWLIQQGIVVDFQLRTEYRLFAPRETTDESHSPALENKTRTHRVISYSSSLPGYLVTLYFTTEWPRHLAQQLNEKSGPNGRSKFVPVVKIKSHLGQAAETSVPGVVAQVVLNQMPAPSVDTSFEQILEFKRDPDTQLKVLALRDWMNEVGHKEQDPKELIERLDYLKSAYREHMRRAKLKVDLSVWEATTVAAADSLGNALKLDWGRIAKAGFVLKHREVDLLDAESKAPGREISYLVRAEDKFIWQR
jgi:hypothetical protein